VVANKRFVKIFAPPLSSSHEEFSTKIARDFQMICFYSYSEFVMGGFFLPSGTNVFNFSIRTMFYNEVLLNTVI
jgi:hypothetical protein